jgi:signal transduction histidine kinase
MRLAHKLTIALVISIFTVLMCHAVLDLLGDLHEYENNVAEDLPALGHGLRVASTAEYRAGGRERARSLLRAAAADGVITSDWRKPDALAADSGLSDAQRDALKQGKDVIVYRGDSVESLTPVVRDGQLKGALNIRHSLAGAHAHFRSVVVRSILTTMVIVAICAVVALTVAHWFIGRPLGALIVQTERVGNGDLVPDLDPRTKRNDEIGRLASAMNVMCVRLAEARARVEAESGARIAALEQLRHADRLRMVGQLASGIAHELGTPLNVVGGRARMILEEPAESTANARIIVEQAEKMATTIRQLLDFARRREPEYGMADLRHVLRLTHEMLSPVAEKQGVVCRFPVDESPAIVRMDAFQVQQAVVNLVMNGIQASPPGGEVRVELMVREVEPVGGQKGEYACVAVEDHGPGIAGDDLRRVFEPFYTTKEVGEGTGLGLSVAYGIAQEHGGWISVQSRVGEGSRFDLYLPIARSEPEAQA